MLHHILYFTEILSCLTSSHVNTYLGYCVTVLVAETIAYYFPKLVELHNYPPATGTKLKIENWSVLNR